MNQRRDACVKALADVNEEFSWGIRDCVQFVTKFIFEITGKNYAADFNYESEEEAAEILKGFGGLEGLFTSRLGEPVSIEKLLDGDPVLIKCPTLELMGVMINGRVLAKSKEGVVTIADKWLQKGWNI